eukprot:590138-Amorphochlora_amoeboformis.AAC.1
MGSKQSSTAKLQILINTGDVRGLRHELSLRLRPSVVRRAFHMAVQAMNLKIISEFVSSKAVTDHSIRKRLLHSLAPTSVENTLWLPIQYSKRTKLDLVATICYLASVANSVDDKDSRGCTILSKACYWGHTELAQYLIERTGANPHLTTKLGETTLMFAVCAGDLKLVRYLVEVQKVKVDAQASNGCTALIMAVIQSQCEIVAYLCGEARADMTLKGRILPNYMFTKKTALEYAKDLSDKNILHILENRTLASGEDKLAKKTQELKLKHEVIGFRGSWIIRSS